MNHKILLLITILLFLTILPQSLALVKEFDGKLFSGDSVTVDQLSMIFTLNSDEDRMFVKAGDEYYQSINIEKCEDLANLKICFLNVTFDDNEEKLKMEVEVYRKTPEFKITRTMNSQQFRIGEDVDITMTLTNTGDPATEIYYSDDFPPEIEIIDVDGPCSKEENVVTWRGHMDKDDSLECVYTIRASSQMERGFKATLRYFDGFEYQTEYSTELKLEADSLLDIQTRLVGEEFEASGTELDFNKDNSELSLGETGKLVIKITNEFGDSINIDGFTITLPEGLQYVSTGSIRFRNPDNNFVVSSSSLTSLGDNTLTWSGGLDSGKTKTFIVEIIGDRKGSPEVTIVSDYHDNNNHYREEHKELLRILDKGIKVRYWLEDTDQKFATWTELEDDDEQELEGLNEYNLRISVQNLNPYTKLFDVSVTPLTDMISLSRVNIPEIEDLGKIYSHKIAFLAPKVETKKKFPFRVDVDYTTEGGEKMSNVTIVDFTVQEFKDLQIAHNFEKNRIQGGEEVQVTVTVKNDRLVDINKLLIEENIPSEFRIVGVTKNTLVLKRGTEVDVYKYKLKAPFVKEKTEFNITTNAKYFDEDTGLEIVKVQDDVLTVEPREPDINFDTKIDTKYNDATIGQLVEATYSIRNLEDEEMIRDIKIYFPLQNDTDIEGRSTYKIVKLDPEESIELKDLVWIRPKVNGTIEIVPALMEFYDEQGNRFYKNSSKEEFDVDDSSIYGPALIINKIVPETVNETKDFTIKIELKNIGNEQVNAVIQDGDRNWSVSLKPGKKKTIEYTSSFFLKGIYELGKAVASYSAGENSYFTASNSPVVEVVEFAPQYAEVKEPAHTTASSRKKILEERSRALTEKTVDDEDTKSEDNNNIFYLFIGIIVALVIVALIIQFKKNSRPENPFLEE